MAIINCIRFTLMTLLVVFVFVSVALAEIRSTKIRSDRRPIIPFDEFGFTHGGRLELKVSQIAVSATTPDQEFAKLGFFLCTRDAWLHVLQQINDGDISCALDSEFISSVFTFNNITAVDKSFQTLYVMMNPDQYTLVFANCIKGLKVSMNVNSVMYNLASKYGGRNYLSAGKTVLPTVYFLFSFIYFALGCLWVRTLYEKRLTDSWFHFFVLAVVIIDTLNLLCEAENMRYIKKTGTAHRWAVLLYIFSFLKEIMLFPLFLLLVLIEMYFSVLKHDSQEIGKKVLLLSQKGILVQVVANIAQVMIGKTGPFAQDWVAWKQLFLLVDVVCCFAVLFPIVWSTMKLSDDGSNDFNPYLTEFRYRYIVVTGCIYFTHVVVYTLETIASYKYHWTSVVAAEFATLVFYVFLQRLLYQDMMLLSN